MVKNKKKKRCTNYKSIYSDNLILNVEDKQAYINITITNSSYKYIYEKLFVLLITASINLFLLYWKLVPLKLIVVLFLLTTAYMYILLRTFRAESLILVKGFGLQIERQYFYGSKSTFIPFEELRNILINEVIFRNKVIYLLTLIVNEDKTKEKLIPLFRDTLPRLACLKVVYCILKKTTVVKNNVFNTG